MANKTKILLVEDDVMIVEMYGIRLREEGYEVLNTEVGTDAIAIAKKENPAIVLLDIMLPEMDGFSILKELKNDTKTKKIPVMLLTNLGQESDRKKGETMGAVDYFVKAKHTPLEVVERIKKIIK